jgi:ankyrin repeat protein
MNQSPEALAIQVFLPEVASVLSAVESPSSKLIRAVVDLDPDAVKNQLEQMQSQGSLAAAINGKGRDGLSALHHACKVGFLAGIDLLLEFQVDIQCTDLQRGAQALWWAARYGHSSAASLLCRKAAPPSARARDGTSALHGACFHGMSALVETLLADRALDTAWTDGEGLTALDLACGQGHLSTVKVIESHISNTLNFQAIILIFEIHARPFS